MKRNEKFQKKRRIQSNANIFVFRDAIFFFEIRCNLFKRNKLRTPVSSRPYFLVGGSAKRRHRDVAERAVLSSFSHSHFQLPSYCHSVNLTWQSRPNEDTLSTMNNPRHSPCHRDERKSCVVCIPRYCERDHSWKLVLRTRWILNFNGLVSFEDKERDIRSDIREICLLRKLDCNLLGRTMDLKLFIKIIVSIN